MKNHVLILDDETEVRSAIGMQLKDSRFDVLEAENFEQALALLQDNAVTIDVIICDVRMPGVDGVEAVATFQQEYPTTPVIILTGFPDVDLAVHFDLPAGAGCNGRTRRVLRGFERYGRR